MTKYLGPEVPEVGSDEVQLEFLRLLRCRLTCSTVLMSPRAALGGCTAVSVTHVKPTKLWP